MLTMDMEQNKSAEQISYEEYKKIGGILNRKDYERALFRAKELKTVNKAHIAQVENTARFAGIELKYPEGGYDPRIALYAVLRADENPEPKSEDHHSELSDQRLFAEVLRMLGDTESLRKLIYTHPNIFTEGK